MQNPKMEDQASTVSFCPSFNTYSSSDHLSAIAVRVTEEEEEEKQNQNASDHTNHLDEEEEDDFEFVLVRSNPHDCSTTGAGGDPMMMNSYPVFNRDLLLEYENDIEIKDDQDEELGSAIRLPLEKLFIEDRDPLSSSSSSSEADELEGIKPGTYCVWTPAKSPSPSPSRCKKSNSTGSSSSSSSKQKWRLRDLLHLRRSNSANDGGKESVIFFNSDPSKSIISGGESNSKLKTTAVKGGGKAAAAAKEKVSAHEVFYVRNKALKEGDKRRSYLPYRQGLVGFFSNVNGLGRSFPPF